MLKIKIFLPEKDHLAQLLQKTPSLMPLLGFKTLSLPIDWLNNSLNTLNSAKLANKK